LIIYDEELQGTSSKRIILKKLAYKIFANPQSVILKKSDMMKVLKLKRIFLCLDIDHR